MIPLIPFTDAFLNTPTDAPANTPMDDPAVQAIMHRHPSKTDPNGSYTGNPAAPDETPQQDADDL